MGIITDMINGGVAVVAIVVGELIGLGIVAAVNFPFLSILLAIVGIFITGFGLRRRGLISAVIVGIGLGFAGSVVSLIRSYI